MQVPVPRVWFCTCAICHCVALPSAKGSTINQNSRSSPVLTERIQPWPAAVTCHWLRCKPCIHQSCSPKVWPRPVSMCSVQQCTCSTGNVGYLVFSHNPVQFLWPALLLLGGCHSLLRHFELPGSAWVNSSQICSLQWGYAKPPVSDRNIPFLPDTRLRLFSPAVQ